MLGHLYGLSSSSHLVVRSTHLSSLATHRPLGHLYGSEEDAHPENIGHSSRERRQVPSSQVTSFSLHTDKYNTESSFWICSKHSLGVVLHCPFAHLYGFHVGHRVSEQSNKLETQFALGHSIGVFAGHFFPIELHSSLEATQVLSKQRYGLSEGHSVKLLQKVLFSTHSPSAQRYGLYSGHSIPISHPLVSAELRCNGYRLHSPLRHLKGVSILQLNELKHWSNDFAHGTSSSEHCA